MPIYEYTCNTCRNHFDLLRGSSEDKDIAFCPICHDRAERQLSSFSFYSALLPNSAEVRAGRKKEKDIHADILIEEQNAKNPDPLKSWREERCKTLKVGPEKWQEYANEKFTEENKVNTYGEGWQRTEV